MGTVGPARVDASWPKFEGQVRVHPIQLFRMLIKNSLLIGFEVKELILMRYKPQPKLFLSIEHELRA